MPTTSNTADIEALTAEAIQLGREIAEAFGATQVCQSPHDDAFIRRCLARIASGDAFDPRDDGGLETITALVDRSLDKEILRYDLHGGPTTDPEHCLFGQILEVPVYTARGETLFRLRSHLNVFTRARMAVRNRLDARDVLMRRMSE